MEMCRLQGLQSQSASPVVGRLNLDLRLAMTADTGLVEESEEVCC
jgi:hypothetical protein